MEVFSNYMKEEADKLYYMFPPRPMEPLKPEQWREFGRSSKCQICLEHFKPWDIIVRNHCHYTGKCRGAAHQKCNLQYEIPHYIPFIFHTLSCYDVHLFIRELGKKFDSAREVHQL